MFESILETVQENVETVRSIIRTNEELRKLLFSKDFIIDEDNQYYQQLSLIKQLVPNTVNWRLYDHYSVVMRLYAIYEQFVKELITDWSNYLPEIFSNYSELPEKVRKTHQIGVSKLLMELQKDKTRFEHLSVDKVIRGLYLGLSENEDDFELLADAFILHEQNLRKEILETLLSKAGISDSWKWVEKHRKIKDFLGNENTAEGQLKEIIDYRNDAAHGGLIEIDNVLSENQLVDLCTFIEALCQALAELVTYKIIEKQKLIGQIKEIGKISRWFDKLQACQAKIQNTQLSVGEELFLVSEDTAYCKSVKIESIMDKHDNQQQKINLMSEQVLGLKFNSSAKKGLIIFQYVPKN
ncbi:MAE_28990/MAE_18760 family HEPN-like nuclease [Cyanothece sp. BG0011]|uniref:MAE_28990/MAE_18760 family HEPN-like nuclease n=1 Tax=Cyanothece sp. BG0011 TaxID=2082950 RepID=UPI000D1DDA86|nr:MAE_28990/MAE_18760 family HEPN-like nuclease [Cyanothece sp. BG0011]